jgi:ribonuclease HII
MNRFERQARQGGYHWVAGVDEAGRGPLAGPVVAAAVVFPPDYENDDINDSKQLTARKRESLYERIREDALAVGFGVIEADVIDRINILQASLTAMRDAVLELAPPPDYLLVDGCHRIPLVMPQEAIVRGDSKSLSIAAASILAKVTRDRIMEIYHRQYPHYNFKKNKGYGTHEHRKAIHARGYCKIHRRSFRLKELCDVQGRLL